MLGSRQIDRDAGFGIFDGYFDEFRRRSFADGYPLVRTVAQNRMPDNVMSTRKIKAIVTRIQDLDGREFEF